MRFIKCASDSSPISIRKWSVAELVLKGWHHFDAMPPVVPVLAIRIAQPLELLAIPGAGIRALLAREQVHRTDLANRLTHARAAPPPDPCAAGGRTPPSQPCAAP